MSIVRTRRGVEIPQSAISFEFSRSGGPGGQHVNTASTKVRAVLVLSECGFDDQTLSTLRAAFGEELVVTASDERSQLANRRRAVERICQKIDDTLRHRPERKETRPSAASVQRRLEEKRHRSERKRSRQDGDW